jgi:glycosyltransferase involved in cell wall biosynthesis
MPEPLPLSLVVITRDAAGELPGCLASAAFASEALVVDSGSADHTVALARAAGARVLEEPWRGFGPQKQFAVDAARHDWVLCLDADERITPRLERSIRQALGTRRYHAWRVARRNRFLGRWLAHGEGYPDRVVRLFDRRRARWSDDAVHEHVVCQGSVGRVAGDLLHASAESLDAYLAKQNRYTTLQAEALHAREARTNAARLVLAPLARFLRFYVVRLGFLDGGPGFAHIVIGCNNTFHKYLKLIELQQAGARRDDA